MFHPTHNNLIECNLLRFRPFTSLHTRHKLLSRWNLSHCCGPVVDPSLGTPIEPHTITTFATRRGQQLQRAHIKWVHFILWHVAKSLVGWNLEDETRNKQTKMTPMLSPT
jgi:hypothetical protein